MSLLVLCLDSAEELRLSHAPLLPIDVQGTLSKTTAESCVGSTDTHLGTSHTILLLGAHSWARQYQQDYGDPPPNVAQWVQEHVQGAGSLLQNFSKFA